MSVRIEWMSATAAEVYVLGPGAEASDGQTVESGDLGLEIVGDGGCCVEGTRAELEDLIARMKAALDRTPDP